MEWHWPLRLLLNLLLLRRGQGGTATWQRRDRQRQGHHCTQAAAAKLGAHAAPTAAPALLRLRWKLHAWELHALDRERVGE